MAVFYIIMIILSLIGIVEIFSFIFYHTMSVKNECSTMLITPINENSDYEMIIRSAIQKSKWMGTFRPKRIIIITDNISKDTLADIEILTMGYSYIEIYDKKDMDTVLKLL